MSNYYDWPRFLVARDGSVILDSQDYLVDPEAEYGEISNPDAKAFHDIQDHPILILLGEPGIGKSTLLHEAEQIAERNERHSIPFSLGEYSNDDRLIRELENVHSEVVETDTRPTDLLIDSLDEGILSIPQLARILGQCLESFKDIKNLRIRLTCRSAVWPTTLEDRLKELWGEDSTCIYELAPLRRIDVENALVAEDIDPEPFFHDIALNGAGPLANRPVTLDLLIKIRKANQALPSRRVELYRLGCEHLCEETNRDRRDSGRHGNRTPMQRMTIAARIAAVIMLVPYP